MSKFDKVIEQYVIDRDKATIEAVETDKLEPFKAFVNKWRALGIYPTCFKLPSDEVLEISVRKMVIHEVNAPESTKQKATEWLLSRGYDLELE